MIDGPSKKLSPLTMKAASSRSSSPTDANALTSLQMAAALLGNTKLTILLSHLKTPSKSMDGTCRSYSTLEMASKLTGEEDRVKGADQKGPVSSALLPALSSDDPQSSKVKLPPSSIQPISKKQKPGERLQRSRERNRIHARKTRQRKKEQMQSLQSRADDLKQEQIQLKQTINEKNTASILVGLFSSNDKNENQVEDPRIEALLRRPAEDIPDASKLPELPSLILPGQHNSKKLKVSQGITCQDELPDDGIDYELLGKDRSKCTSAELDQIRRERNRMHAKRTRDRKRLFMEEMADMCKKLEEENDLLRYHLDSLNGIVPHSDEGSKVERRTVVSPLFVASASVEAPPKINASESSKSADNGGSAGPVSEHGVTFDQIKTLLEAAGAFSSSVSMSASAISASTNTSDGDSVSDQDDHHHSYKRRRLNGSAVASSVPRSITTSTTTAVGC